MHYVYIENSKVISILDYAGNVPPTITIHEINDLEYTQITRMPRTHYFDTNENVVKPIPDPEKEKISTAYLNEENNRQFLRFLDDTDWKVLRHIRQKILNEKTTLTEDEYLSLESQRSKAAASIVK